MAMTIISWMKKFFRIVGLNSYFQNLLAKLSTLSLVASLVFISMVGDGFSQEEAIVNLLNKNSFPSGLYTYKVEKKFFPEPENFRRMSDDLNVKITSLKEKDATANASEIDYLEGLVRDLEKRMLKERVEEVNAVVYYDSDKKEYIGSFDAKNLPNDKIDWQIQIKNNVTILNDIAGQKLQIYDSILNPKAMQLIVLFPVENLKLQIEQLGAAEYETVENNNNTKHLKVIKDGYAVISEYKTLNTNDVTIKSVQYLSPDGSPLKRFQYGSNYQFIKTYFNSGKEKYSERWSLEKFVPIEELEPSEKPAITFALNSDIQIFKNGKLEDNIPGDAGLAEEMIKRMFGGGK